MRNYGGSVYKIIFIFIS